MGRDLLNDIPFIQEILLSVRNDNTLTQQIPACRQAGFPRLSRGQYEDDSGAAVIPSIHRISNTVPLAW